MRSPRRRTPSCRVQEQRDRSRPRRQSAQDAGADLLVQRAWQNGDTLPEIKEIFVEEPIYRRTGIINAYDDPTFRNAFESLVAKTGRRHVIVSGVTIGTKVFPVV